MTDPKQSPRTTFESLAWVDHAFCANFHPAVMYPHPGDEPGVRFAKSICARCPVQPECLERALERNEQYGVWGGMSEEERRSLKRRQSRAQKTKAVDPDEQAFEDIHGKQPRKRNHKKKIVPIVPIDNLL